MGSMRSDVYADQLEAAATLKQDGYTPLIHASQVDELWDRWRAVEVKKRRRT